MLTVLDCCTRARASAWVFDVGQNLKGEDVVECRRLRST